MFKHLEKFAAKKGFLYLKQLDLNALREFRESWELGPRTAMKKHSLFAIREYRIPQLSTFRPSRAAALAGRVADGGSLGPPR
jgi:hypothetical protein